MLNRSSVESVCHGYRAVPGDGRRRCVRPGSPGELTQYLPSGLAGDVLEMTGAVQKRMRALPSRAGMYFVLAMTLFPGIGYLRVWDKMTAALEDLGLPRPSEKALRDLRRRLGPAPAKAVSGTVAVLLASP